VIVAAHEWHVDVWMRSRRVFLVLVGNPAPKMGASAISTSIPWLRAISHVPLEALNLAKGARRHGTSGDWRWSGQDWDHIVEAGP
jgi:hypothetical protein